MPHRGCPDRASSHSAALASRRPGNTVLPSAWTFPDKAWRCPGNTSRPLGGCPLSGGQVAPPGWAGLSVHTQSFRASRHGPVRRPAEWLQIQVGYCRLLQSRPFPWPLRGSDWSLVARESMTGSRCAKWSIRTCIKSSPGREAMKSSEKYERRCLMAWKSSPFKSVQSWPSTSRAAAVQSRTASRCFTASSVCPSWISQTAARRWNSSICSGGRYNR